MVILLVFGFISSLINWAFSAINPDFCYAAVPESKGLHFPVGDCGGLLHHVPGAVFVKRPVFAGCNTRSFLEKSIGV